MKITSVPVTTVVKKATEPDYYQCSEQRKMY